MVYNIIAQKNFVRGELMTRLGLYAKTGQFDNADYIKALRELKILKHKVSSVPMTREEMSRRSMELYDVYQSRGIHSLTQEDVKRLLKK